MKTSFAFSRRGPDRLTEELAAVLTPGASFEFKALFTVVYASLKAKKLASGGEELLRLRAYEKLQNLVQGGLVLKIGKEYSENPGPMLAYQEAIAAQREEAMSLAERSPGSPALDAITSPTRVPAAAHAD